jgi:hypothetical protein
MKKKRAAEAPYTPELAEQLAGTSFTPLSRNVMPRVVLSVAGMPKTGKLHFALTAPGPIVLMSTDKGHEGVAKKFPKKEIWEAQYDMHPPKKVREDKDRAIEWTAGRWEQFCSDYHAALKASGARTVVIDNGSDTYEACRMARFGRLTQVMPENYGPLKAEMRDLIRKAYDHECNVIWLHRLKERWEGRSPTGRFEIDGFKEMDSHVQASLVTVREDQFDDNGKATGSLFKVVVKDSRHNPMLNGTEFPLEEGADPDFASVASMLVPGVPEEVWSE